MPFCIGANTDMYANLVADADIDTHANPICIDMSAHIDTHADDIGSITPAYKVVSVLLSALASKSQSLGLAVPGVRLPRLEYNF